MNPLWPCPCCGYLTIDDESPPPGTYFICPVCGWEDDPVQFADATYRGGANEDSLNEVRADFLAWRAAGYPSDARRRAPLAAEIPRT